MDTKVDAGAFADFDDFLLNLFGRFCDHFFDAGRVNPAVGDQFMQ